MEHSALEMELQSLRKHKEWADQKIDQLIRRVREAEGPQRLLKQEVQQLRLVSYLILALTKFTCLLQARCSPILQPHHPTVKVDHATLLFSCVEARNLSALRCCRRRTTWKASWRSLRRACRS